MRPLLPALPLLAAWFGAAFTPPAPRSAPVAFRQVAPHSSPVAYSPTLVAPSPSLVAPTDSLRAQITARIAATPGAEVAIWFEDLARHDSLALGSDLSFHAASTMKVPVMIELFRRFDSGKSASVSELFLQNAFASLVDGSIYTLDPKDDSDSAMYTMLSQNVSLADLNEHMITRSSNLAANTLLQYLDPVRITATARALGARDIQVLRGVEDGKAFAKGLNNTTTAHDLGVLLAAIERGKAASRVSCDSMRQVLLRQQFHDEIPAGLPAATPVAHKTGWITGTLHDAAIVYPKGRGPYVLVVLTRKIPAQKDAQALIADVSRLVYGYVMRK